MDNNQYNGYNQPMGGGQPMGGYNQPMGGGQPMGGYNQPTGSNNQSMGSYQKKSKTGLIVAIAIIAVICIACAILAPKLLSKKLDGTYKLTSMTQGSQTLSEADMKDSGVTAKLIINGKNVTLDLNGDKYIGKIEIDGDDIKIVDAEDSIPGKYDKSNKTITLDYYGIDMVFTKQ